jgi:hypothetical protein
MRSLLILLVTLALGASVAEAQSWLRKPDNTGWACGSTLGPKDSCFYYMTETADDDSGVITVAKFADVHFNADLGATGTATGQIVIRRIINYTASANTSEIVAVDVDGDGAVDNGILDGDPGTTSGSQRATIWDLGPGRYYVDVTTGVGAGEIALVELIGHE